MYQSNFDSSIRLWSGPNLRGILNPNISIGQAMLWAMQRCPNNIAQISHDSGIEVTFADMRIRTIRAAQNIQKLGFVEDDVFAIIARNSENLAPIVFAAMSIGCPVNTLDPSFTVFEVEHMFKITQPKLIFCDSDKLPVVQESLAALNLDAIIYTFDEETEYSRPVEDLLTETGEEESFM